MLFTLNATQGLRLKAAVPTDTAEVYYLADWLNHLNLFTDHQLYEILKFARPVLERYAAADWELTDGPLTLAIVESRWISITGKTGFLDAETLRLVPALPSPGVTYMLCDIMAMRAVMQQRIQLLKKAGKLQEDTANDASKACVG